jgi:hypothetical protein
MFLLMTSYDITGILAPQDVTRLYEDSIDIIRKLIISGTLCLSERLAQQSKFDPVTSNGDEEAAAAAGSPLGSLKLTQREEKDGFAELTYEAFKRAQHLCAILQSRLEGLGKCFARRRRAEPASAHQIRDVRFVLASALSSRTLTKKRWKQAFVAAASARS